jgi:hypothetical protein
MPPKRDERQLLLAIQALRLRVVARTFSVDHRKLGDTAESRDEGDSL